MGDTHHRSAPKVQCSESAPANSSVGHSRPHEGQDKEGEDGRVRGDPGPFGLLCFGMTTCMLMFITTGWAEKAFLPTVFSYAFFYGGFGQFVAGILELIKGNTFGGTAFASYGSFWMGWFLMKYIAFSSSAAAQAARTGMGLWCGLWAVLTAGFFVVTLRKNGCLATVFSTLVITFALLAGGEWNHKCERAAGYVGFFCGSSAIYAAFAFLGHAELGLSPPGVKPINWLPSPHAASVQPVTPPSPQLVTPAGQKPSADALVLVRVVPSRTASRPPPSGLGAEQGRAPPSALGVAQARSPPSGLGEVQAKPPSSGLGGVPARSQPSGVDAMSPRSPPSGVGALAIAWRSPSWEQDAVPSKSLPSGRGGAVLSAWQDES